MSLSKQQQALLDILVEFRDVMEKNDIQFFLFGGSALGAVRHRGFIPWDDDLDVIIDTKNFYKMLEVFKNGPIGNINLVYFHNEPKWHRSYAMIVSTKDTCYTGPFIYTEGLASGSRIDIMILDGVPADRIEEYRHDLMLYQEVLTDTLLIDRDIYYIRDEYYALKEREEQVGKETIELQLRKKLESYITDGSEYLVVRFSTNPRLRYYLTDTIYEPKYIKFEGFDMPVPAKPEQQLRQQYGSDWFIIPKSEDRQLHHFFYNDKISGNNYHEDILQFVDRAATGEAERNIKYNVIERVPYSKKNAYYKDNLLFQRELMRLGLSTREEEFLELFRDQKYRQYCLELQPLQDILKNITNVDHEKKNLSEMIMKKWLMSLVILGEFYIASKIVNAFELGENQKYSEELQLISTITELEAAIQDKKEESIFNHLEKLATEGDFVLPEVIKGRFFLNRCNSKSWTKLLVSCDKYLNVIPDNYDILKVKADILSQMGQFEQALKIYGEVYKNSQNGLDRLEIKNIIEPVDEQDGDDESPFRHLAIIEMYG